MTEVRGNPSSSAANSRPVRPRDAETAAARFVGAGRFTAPGHVAGDAIDGVPPRRGNAPAPGVDQQIAGPRRSLDRGGVEETAPSNRRGTSRWRRPACPRRPAAQARVPRGEAAIEHRDPTCPSALQQPPQPRGEGTVVGVVMPRSASAWRNASATEPFEGLADVQSWSHHRGGGPERGRDRGTRTAPECAPASKRSSPAPVSASAKRQSNDHRPGARPTERVFRPASVVHPGHQPCSNRRCAIVAARVMEEQRGRSRLMRRPPAPGQRIRIRAGSPPMMRVSMLAGRAGNRGRPRTPPRPRRIGMRWNPGSDPGDDRHDAESGDGEHRSRKSGVTSDGATPILRSRSAAATAVYRRARSGCREN